MYVFLHYEGSYFKSHRFENLEVIDKQKIGSAAKHGYQFSEDFMNNTIYVDTFHL